VREQLVRKMRSDEPGPAGDENRAVHAPKSPVGPPNGGDLTGTMPTHQLMR
jgi:hypothetical protein